MESQAHHSLDIELETRSLIPFLKFLSLIQKGTGITGIAVIDRNYCSFERNFPQKVICNLGLKDPEIYGNHSNKINSFDRNYLDKGM